MKLNFLIAFFILFFTIKGQKIDNSSFESINVNNIMQVDKIFTTPEVMAFHKLNFLPTDLYTGKIKVDIPLYEIKSGNITVPISLSYNAEGIKIDNEASDVGMNWVLNAGGNILRIVKDLDDHTLKYNLDYQYDPYTGDGDTNLKSIGHYLTSKGFLKEYDDLKQITNYISTHYNLKSIASEDALPDLFLVNSPSLSTKFHFEKGKSYIKYKPKIMDGSGIKIEDVNYNEFSYENVKNIIGFKGEEVFNNGFERDNYLTNYMKNFSWYYNPPKDYSNFKITNINGLVYNFNDYDLIETIPIWNGIDEFPDPYVTFYNTPMDFIRNNHSLKKSVWHLNSIYDPSTNKEIKFTYKTNTSSHVYEKNMYIFKKLLNKNSLNSLNLENGFTKNVTIQTNDYSLDFEAKYKYIDDDVIFNKLIQQQKIKEIIWEKGKVEFFYNLNRLDKDHQNALTDIIVSDQNGKPIKHFKFQYSYFISKEKCDDPKCKRLKLISIDLLNINTSKTEQKYTFEYDESEPLPNVESLEQDYLGYYNKNGSKYDKYVDHGFEYTFPNKHSMYFCPGQKQFSLLPFNLNNKSCIHIPDNYSLEANSYSLLGMLKKITYPTGGEIEFEYENHKFNLFGNEITAGGARIKKQKIKDDNGKYRIFSYEYKNNNISSGYINNIPKYGDIKYYENTEKWCDECYEYDRLEGCIEKCFPAEKKIFFYFYNRSKSEIELTSGSFVGYSRVIEKEEGNGYKEYYYASPIDYPNEHEKLLNVSNDASNLLARNSHYPGIAYINNDIRRGKLLKEITYNQNNQILQKNEYTYTYKLFDETPLKFRKTYIQHLGVINSTSVDSFGDEFETNLRTERNILTKKETNDYLDNGNIYSVIEYEYDNQYPLLKKEIKKDPTVESMTYYKYPTDFAVSNSLMAELTNQNRISTPVTTEVLRKEDGSEKQISFTETRYAQDGTTSNLILPKYIFTKKGEAILEKKITYDKYDNKGNLLQYTMESGIPVSIIWGYDQQYPIGKIEGASYSEIESYVINLQNLSNNFDEQGLLSAYTSLRNGLPLAMITTYTYLPLIGVSTITPPNGLTEYYTYDDAGRLKEIKNQDGQLLKSFEYHYRSQN